MPVVINGKKFYRTAEAYRLLGISRNTLFKWLNEDDSGNCEYRDVRGWRLITEEQIERLRLQSELIITQRRRR